MIDLGKHVMDKTMLDARGRRAGKVDDLVLDWPEDQDGRHPAEPEVVAILTGPLALTQQWRGWSPLARLAYRLIGLRDPHPVEVPWSRVAALDVVVYLNAKREDIGLEEPSRSANRRYIARIPGA